MAGATGHHAGLHAGPPPEYPIGLAAREELMTSRSLLAFQQLEKDLFAQEQKSYLEVVLEVGHHFWQHSGWAG